MQEMRRIWKNSGFWFSIGLGVFAMFYPHMDTRVFWETPFEYFASADFLYFMLMPLHFGLTKLLLPLIVTLPAAAFLAEDQRNRTHLLLVHRFGPWRYMRRRMAQAAGAAVFAALAGLLIYTLFAAIACPWHDNIVSSWRELDGYPFDGWVNRFEGLPFLGFQFLCLGLSSAVWGLAGFSIACLTRNGGVVVGGTFLAHYLASWLCMHSLPLRPWNPIVLQAPDTRYGGSIVLIVARLLVWLALAVLLSAVSAQKFIDKVEEG